MDPLIFFIIIRFVHEMEIYVEMKQTVVNT